MSTVEQFELAASVVSTTVIHATMAEADGIVEQLLASMGAQRIVSDSQKVSLPGFERSTPAEADCGITDAEWGIASTGSAILPITVERHRAASLLQPASIILLEEARILPDLPSALGFLGETYMKSAQRPSSVIVVTGPSRTADIELNLVTDVPGPKKLFIVLLR